MLFFGFFLMTAEGNAQTASFDKNSPTVNGTSISGSGTYDCGAGHTLYQVIMIATGPLGSSAITNYKDTYSGNNPGQKGTWTCSISNLPAGQYNVSITLIYQDSFGSIVKVKPVQAAGNPYTVGNPPSS